MKVDMTGHEEWEFAITGIDRRTLLMLANATQHYRDEGQLNAPEDWELLNTAHALILDALYPSDAVMTFQPEAQP